MTRSPLVWLRRGLLLAGFGLAGLAALIAAAPERPGHPDPDALPALVAARQAALAALAADAPPAVRAEAEAMLADARRTVAQLDGDAGAARAALALYDRARGRLRGAGRPDLLGHVELHRGELLAAAGRVDAARTALAAAQAAFAAAGRPLVARTAAQRLDALPGDSRIKAAPPSPGPGSR
jgi:hypothetical protein